MRNTITKKKNGVLGTLSIALAFFLTSCGLDVDFEQLTNKMDRNYASEDQDFEIIQLPVNIDASINDPESFGLTALSCNVKISGTDSEAGYNFSYDSALHGPAIEIVNGDKLKLKVTELKCGNRTFTATGGTNFTTWLTNDTATFKNTASASDFAQLKYLSDCNNGCGIGNQLKIAVTALSLGDNVVGNEASYSAAINFSTGGALAPDYKFFGFKHSGFDITNGRLKFAQAWKCNVLGSPAIVDPPGDNTNAACNGIKHTDHKVAWVDDPASGGTPTAAQMNTAINSLAGAQGSKSVLVGDLVKSGTNPVPHQIVSVASPPATFDKDGFAVNDVLTGDDAYGKPIKYACIYKEEMFEGQQRRGILCSKVTFTAIQQ